MIVTIDGPAGVGKSSVASFLATELDLLLLKSGSFYRALSLHLQRTLRLEGRGAEEFDEIFRGDEKTEWQNWQGLWEIVQVAEIYQDGEQIFLQGEDVTLLLQTTEMDALTPHISKMPALRDFINGLLHRQAEARHLVAEGRDMGTVVFPQAEHKFFLDASPAVRAKRRWLQLSPTEPSRLAELQRQIEERDAIDRNKKIGALRAAEDARVIDTSNLTFAAVCQIIAKSF